LSLDIASTTSLLEKTGIAQVLPCVRRSVLMYNWSTSGSTQPGGWPLWWCRVPSLSYGFICVITRLAVLVQYQLVTDWQTEEWTHNVSIYLI